MPDMARNGRAWQTVLQVSSHLLQLDGKACTVPVEHVEKTCSRACRTSTKRRWCRRPCDCLRRLCASRACTHKHTHTHTHTTTRIDTQALRCTHIHKHTHVRTNRSRGDILRKKGPHELAVVKEVDRLRTAVELCTPEHVVVPPPSLHPLGPRRLRAGPQLSPTHGGHCASTDGENANTMQRS